MKIISLDAETFFCSKSGYTLKKLTTEEYLRNPRFKVHCWGSYDPQTDGIWNGWGDWAGTAILNHHSHFDGAILQWHERVRPAFYLDTLSMARLVMPRAKSHSLGALAAHFGLPEKTVPYNEFDGVENPGPLLMANLREGANHDAWLTYQIFLRLLPHVPRDELRVIDSTIRLFTEPVLRLDVRRCAAFVVAERQKKAALLAAAETNADAMQSADKFKVAIESLGYPCPMKWMPPTKTDPEGREIPALAKTDEAMTALLEHEDERVQALAMARLGVKSTLGETRGMRMLQTFGRGPLPVYQKYRGAHTGRTSAGDGSNYSNLPRLDKPGGELRLSILPPEGQVLVIGDSSQIQLRINCALSGEQWVLDALAAGRDVYCELGPDYYGRTITKKDITERTFLKQLILGAGFGMGGRVKSDGKPSRFREYCRTNGIMITDEEAEKAIEGVYRPKHPHIVKFWNKCSDQVLPLLRQGANVVWQQGPVRFELRDHKIYGPNGTYLDYTGLHIDEEGSWRLPTRGGRIFLHGPKLCENVVQFLEVMIIWQAHLRIIDRTPYAKLCLTSYDELVYSAPKEFGLDTKIIVEQELCRVPDWMPGIPLAAEVHISDKYDK
jgi:DNA polymerase